MGKYEKSGGHADDKKEAVNPEAEVTGSLDLDMQYVSGLFVNCSDLITRSLELGSKRTRCFALYLGSLIRKEFVNDNFLKPLMTGPWATGIAGRGDAGLSASVLRSSMIYSYDVEEISLFTDIAERLLSGCCILFINGSKTALSADVKEDKGRKVAESRIESVVKGPQEAFVEDLPINISLLRKRIKTTGLKLEKFNIGRLGAAQGIVFHIDGIAEKETVAEIKRRIEGIDIDIAPDISYIDKLIRDSALSPFPQAVQTERPDKCAAALAQGRIVVMLDGSPNALVMPVTLNDFLVAAEDYYHIFYFSTLIRILRYIAFIVSLLGPSIYIAITTFHQEMIPLPLLITIARSRADIPFPAIIEALLMEFTFELLREAGIRLPQPVGPAVSIVGGLVIGQGVVQAGIVSQIMVIVVALTGVASFAMPAFNTAVTLRFLRFPFMILAAVLGIYGIIMGILVMLIHLAGLRSLGTPYLSPFAPVSFSGLKDSAVLAPLWAIAKRPQMNAGIGQRIRKKGGG